jgi:hypothetical protein
MARAGKQFGTLEQLFDDIWWAWGTVVMGPGVTISRNMVLVREANGDLVAIHPVMMPAAEQAKIDALGPIKHIVRLGSFHGMDDLAYVERYKPQTWSHPDMRLADGITRDHALDTGSATPIAGAQVHGFTGAKHPELVLHVPRHGGVLVACDAIQNWVDVPGNSVMARVMTPLLGFKGPAVLGPAWRKAAEPSPGVTFRAQYDALANLDFKHAIGGHGPLMRDRARDHLKASIAKIYKA